MNRHIYYKEWLRYLQEANNCIDNYKLNSDDFELHHGIKHLEYLLEFLIKYILIMLKDPFVEWLAQNGASFNKWLLLFLFKQRIWISSIDQRRVSIKL